MQLSSHYEPKKRNEVLYNTVSDCSASTFVAGNGWSSLCVAFTSTCDSHFMYLLALYAACLSVLQQQ